MSLKIDNLSKRFDKKWVLRDIGFEVRDGEIFGIFGPSGSGKSTLIKAIAGTVAVTQGKILLNGQDVTDFTPENRAFHLPKISNESIWRALFRKDRSSDLADGEGQRLAFEYAIANAEGVLLLDNSFCEMDVSTRYESLERLRLKVADEGLIVLFASNDYEQMMLASDRVAVIINGTMRQVGTPQELYESPRTVDVARSIGRNNLIEARRLTSSKADIPEFQTMDGGHRLFAKKAEVSGLGSINRNITLAIRPEQISISFGASFPEDNLLKATITDVRFLGPTTLVKLDAGGLGLDALVLRLVGLNVGDECMVGLPPDRISILHN